MERIRARFVGVELYFENLEKAKKFYIETMGLEVSDEQVGHHASSKVVPALFASNGRGLNRIPRKIRRFSSLRCLI